MFNSNSAWNWWNFIMQECDNPLFYLHIVLQTFFFFKTTSIICQVTWSALFKNELLWHSSNGFDHMWSCPVVAYRKLKTKECVKFLAQKVVTVVYEIYVVVTYKRVFETVFDWETKRLFAKWPLTGGGCLREVVAMRELTVVVTYWSLLLLGQTWNLDHHF